uniref:Uncharacterized protein n=1 Tax=Cacopsylla melanoneura TaxID=428564 RepID=A0A8D8TK00_9HEMI
MRDLMYSKCSDSTQLLSLCTSLPRASLSQVIHLTSTVWATRLKLLSSLLPTELIFRSECPDTIPSQLPTVYTTTTQSKTTAPTIRKASVCSTLNTLVLIRSPKLGDVAHLWVLDG